MFGFSFDSWADVTGAMYVGQGFEGTWTLIAVVFLIAVMAKGSKGEQEHYKDN